MRLKNGAGSCKELEVRINGVTSGGLAGHYHLQSDLYNGKRKYVIQSGNERQALKYNTQTQHWEVRTYFCYMFSINELI